MAKKVIQEKLKKQQHLTQTKKPSAKKQISKKAKTANAKNTISNRFDTNAIGQTLVSNDLFLPYKKTRVPDSKARPVIIIDENDKKEYAVVPGSKQKTGNTTKYKKYGIEYYRHNIEVEDNEGMPIKVNDKFKKTAGPVRLPLSDVNKIKDELLNHKKFSSENRRKYENYKNRYKKSKD